MQGRDDINLQQSPRDPLARHRIALWRKWRTLASDKEFIWETARLKYNLNILLADHETVVKKFFPVRFMPDAFSPIRYSAAIKSVEDKQLRRVLRRYTRYVSRFRVVMELHPKQPRFRVRMIDADPRSKFHVKVSRSHFEPLNEPPEDDTAHVSEFFGAEYLPIGSQMQSLIDKGAAKCVWIEDPNKTSLFTQLMDFGYSPHQLTFVVVRSSQPYIFCVLGEAVRVEKEWHEAGKVVSELQEHLYRRVHVGRRPQMRQLRKRLAILLRRHGTDKDLAFLIAGPRSNLYSVMSALSQLRQRLTIR